MAGRQSSSLRNQTAAPVTFAKSGAVSVAALPERWYNPYDVAVKVRKVVASVGTAPTGAGLVVDVKVSGTSVFTGAGARATVPATQFTGTASADKADADAISVKPGQYLTAEVTQVGSTVAGSDLRVTVFLG